MAPKINRVFEYIKCSCLLTAVAGFDEKISVNKHRRSRRLEVCEILFVIQLEPVRQVLPFDWFTTDHLVSGESILH